ncbi:MAG TPA: CpsB/CapC family capsule biosynthesis tyrosine phosphatase, partial [Humisphaera sp.]|nr:CpsB/CapC family capsule biosynthesis tyrosine phosphatase [Humisphaera sp.]
MVAFSHAPLEMCSAQRLRLSAFNVAACPDVHCHCLPGLDDGPQTLADAIALCRALADDGITAVVASPHQMGRYDGRNSPLEIRQAVADLTAALKAERIFLNIHPGADVRIDERLGDLLDRDQVSTIADHGKYLLLELPHDTMIDPLEVIGALRSRGVTSIVTHPERHPYLGPKPGLGIPWIEAGAMFQVTAA